MFLLGLETYNNLVDKRSYAEPQNHVKIPLRSEESTRNSIWDAVGETPLIYLKTLSKTTGCHIFAKAEHLNPTGSIKDRAALRMIQEAEAKGLLVPGEKGTIVEGTGKCFLCIRLGPYCIIYSIFFEFLDLATFLF